MSVVSISEFLHLTKLSESDLIAMLENGELEIAAGPIGELLIDISNLAPEDLANRSTRNQDQLNPEQLELLEEAVASEIVHALDSIVDDALEISLNWRKKNME